MIAKVHTSLDTFAGYMLALLHMMDEVGEISLRDALKEFDHRYHGYLLSKDLKRGPKGREKWELQVQWARNDLAGLGLMGSGGAWYLDNY